MSQPPARTEIPPGRFDLPSRPEAGPDLAGGQRPVYRRRVVLPVVLFLVTCLSTFWAGAMGEDCTAFVGGGEGLARAVVERLQWGDGLRDGLVYMGAVLAILLAHEMGHFVLACYHRVPASFPMFIPMPISPLGTMGAVIAMQGSGANRRQLFDVGIAGPLAGLVVAVPVSLLGVMQASAQHTPGLLEFHQPLLVQLVVAALRPDLAGGPIQMNPLLMAGWVGLLVTGLNMLPVSQLDGGHVSYALLGRKAHYLAHGLIVAAVLYILFTQNHTWIVMLLLVMFIGIKHPPTADDSVPLGLGRRVVGYASLLIPVLCFPPQGITV